MKISIVTPALNRRSFVEKAILSVRDQPFDDIEHLIIDGGSTDGSLDVYRKYPHLKVFVETDKNVYDAFNKGIQKASGDIVGIMNTDDEYASDVFAAIADVFKNNPEVDIVSGGCEFVEAIEGQGTVTRFRYLHHDILSLDERALVRYPVMVNARFYRRSVFEKIGYFDDSFPVVADREFLLRCNAGMIQNQSWPKIVCKYGLHETAISHRKEGVGIDILRENLEAAQSRLHSCPTRERTVWGFWVAWSVLLLAIEIRKTEGMSAAFRLMSKHFFLMLKFCPLLASQLLKHRGEGDLKNP